MVKTVSTKGYPVNDGFCCIKDLSLDKQQKTVKPNSLPKIREKYGSFRQVSWEEGFHYVADKLKNLKKACNVTGFRNMEDVETLKAVAQEAENVIVMGAGLVGIDCAMGFLELGVKVISPWHAWL